MFRLVLVISVLAAGGLALAEPFALNSSEWRLAQSVEEELGAKPLDNCPVQDVQAACFEWNAFLGTARATLDRFMTEDATGRSFIDASGEWEQQSDTEITKAYMHYGKPLVVFFDGRLLVFMKE